MVVIAFCGASITSSNPVFLSGGTNLTNMTNFEQTFILILETQIGQCCHK